jgi:hypothetical protein
MHFIFEKKNYTLSHVELKHIANTIFFLKKKKKEREGTLQNYSGKVRDLTSVWHLRGAPR